MLGTATKLKTARNISLTGAVSGNVNFDGSKNVSINTTQSNIAVLTGSVSVKKSNDPGNTFEQTQKTLNYPDGFTKDNSVIISYGASRDPANKGYSFFNGSAIVGSNSYGWSTGQFPNDFSLRPNDILMNFYSGFNQDVTVYYKLVLMKIS